MLAEKIALNNSYQYDSIQPQDKEELDHHLLVQTCYGAGISSLRHPVVLSELYRTAQADPQGCKILLAREARSMDNGSGKGKIIGSIILYHGSSKMNKYFPTEDRKTGGLVGVVAMRGAKGAPIVEGLISKSILILIEMGFVSAQTFIVRLNNQFLSDS
jgi:beta-N-acetylhexosaminidase